MIILITKNDKLMIESFRDYRNLVFAHRFNVSFIRSTDFNTFKSVYRILKMSSEVLT